MSFAFHEENLGKIERLRGRYPHPQALMLPLLWLAQEQEGWLKPEVFEAVAALSGTSPTEVYQVAAFYTMFRQGAILAALKARLGIDVGETTEDGRFTLSEAECLGSCGTAPMMQINGRNYENLRVETLETILKALP